MPTTVNEGRIVALKKQIVELRKQREGRITPEENQLITDRIQQIKAEIDSLNRPKSKIVPVVNAKTIAERGSTRKHPVSVQRVMI